MRSRGGALKSNTGNRDSRLIKEETKAADKKTAVDVPV